MPHRSSSTPEAAKRKSDHIDDLFGGLKKQKKASVEAEYNSSDAAEDEWDEQERPRCSKRKGEVEDLFATLKKQRSEKAKTQVRYVRQFIAFLGRSCFSWKTVVCTDCVTGVTLYGKPAHCRVMLARSTRGNPAVLSKLLLQHAL